MTISRALARPLSRPLKRNLYSSAAAAFTPTALFANGEQGAWYDPSDLTSLYQTNAGSTQAVVGSTVGLALDKRLMGGATAAAFIAAQPELVTNGGFDSGLTGWTACDVASNTEAASLISNVSGAAVIDASLGNTAAQTSIATTIGVLYKLSVNVTSLGAGNRYWVSLSNTNFTINAARQIGPFSSASAHTFSFVATATTTYIHVHADNLGTPTLTFDNVSVKEIPGNHATQATAASRPILQVDGNGKHYLAFDGVDDFLVTGNINFSATDEMSVFAGVRKLSDAVGVIADVGNAASTTGSVALYTETASRFAANSRGTIDVKTTSTAVFASPITSVLTVLAEISQPLISLRANGALNASSVSSQGTGNYNSAVPLYIGRRGGTSFPLNGNIYSLIVRGKLTADTDLTNTEAYVATQTGVTL